MSNAQAQVELENWQLGFQRRAQRTGLRVFMVVVSALFFLFTIAVITRSQYSDWQSLAEQPWQPLFDPWQLWLNTSTLIGSSLALQWARTSSVNGQYRHASIAFWVAGVFALAFIFGQVWVWSTLVSLGYVVGANPANSFFYVLTALHGLHLLGGLMVWSKIAVKLRQKTSLQQVSFNIELCAIYWHFLLALWLFLFMLLTSSGETFNAIANFCGF